MYSKRTLLTILSQHSIRASRRWSHDEVRVRFAPSPTGYLHLGGLRTALYNYLYSRNKNGKFLLRIEDTDQTRLVPGATESLIEDLMWAGIKIDEGPGFGGEQGPYVQSERKQIYLEAVRELLENDTAYRCFCTERRLELLRKEAIRTRQVPRYDNKCRYLTPQQIAVLLAKNTPYCIRFKLTAHEEPLQDLIYGPVTHNVSENEGDPVIMKSDNFPTYHFANVVDDHLMGVTHVFRGVEWQISTTKHLLLYKAFGWQPPLYGHLPLLVNSDGTKLSKRQGDIGIKSFRDKGYFSEALVNYVVSAGGGFEHMPGQKPQIYSMNELAHRFNIERVNSHPSRLNPDLLNDFNRLHILKLLQSKENSKDLVERVKVLVREAYPKEKNLDLGNPHIENVLKWACSRLTFIEDLTEANLSFLWVRPVEFKLKNVTNDQMESLIANLENIEFTKDNLNLKLKEFADNNNVKFAVFMKTLRSALSGLKEGPGVAEMMDILGKDCVLQRLRSSIHAQSMEAAANVVKK
ncbi:PREDICTED: probable glutamate--tRNA ligase, mitochondrial [Rhagoletis zephyria]|uniref:probable glutamate--tRNA ligase, mitochondrial n=1 Tax=Rhagoletis zephyria TaxID=28612 RepID=UPI0008113509|nr:PREDICTED: probable glutamate--tRNA ligase, mitochondrial [Rhagoletis zephyria]